MKFAANLNLKGHQFFFTHPVHKLISLYCLAVKFELSFELGVPLGAAIFPAVRNCKQTKHRLFPISLLEMEQFSNSAVILAVGIRREALSFPLGIKIDQQNTKE